MTIVIIPAVGFLLQKIAGSIFETRKDTRARYVDTVMVRDDITSGIKEFQQQYDFLNLALPNEILRRCSKETDYKPYMVVGERMVMVIDNDAHHRFSHLRSGVFAKILHFYQLRSLIDAVHADFRSDAFIGLSPARKVQVLENLKHRYGELITSEMELRSELNFEIIQMQKRTYWISFVLRGRRGQ